IDVVHHQRHRWTDLKSVVEARLAGRSSPASNQAELLHVPFAGGNRIPAEQVQMAEVMVRGGVQLDELMVRSIGVSEEKDTLRVASADIADVGDGRGEAGAAIELLLISLLHVFGAPTKVPDG